MSIAACTKSDDIDNTIRQSYIIKVSSPMIDNSNRPMAADSLLTFITDNMGLEKDTAVNSWLVKGESVEACDKEMNTRFEKACSLVDPDTYGGRYAIKVFRKGDDGKKVSIANKEFIATGENDWLSELIAIIKREQEKQKKRYIYDVAIASGNNYDYPHNCLRNAGYTVVEGDLNEDAGGKYIYVGYKAAEPNFVTDIEGTVLNNSTGLMETRKLTAKEAAISTFVCIQNSGHPESFYGPDNSLYRNAVFYPFKQLGDSNGDTNQGSGGDDSFLYFTRDCNETMHIWDMFFECVDFTFPWDDGSSNDLLIKAASYNSSSGRCSSFGGNADLNINTSDDYTYLGFCCQDN